MVLVGASSGTVAAQQRKKSGGLTITPAMQQLVIQESQTKLDGSFTVQNDSDKPAAFELAAIDMGSLDETGGLVFSGLAQDYQKKHGLADWLLVPQSHYDVDPGKVVTVPFAVKNDTALSPGGHYGALIVKQVPRQNTGADTQVSLSPQAASLLFLLKKGGEVYQLSLQKVKAPHNNWSLPTNVSLPFKNEGNVHLVPRGVVRLLDTQNKEIARGIINPESSLVLPDRTRTLGVSFANTPKLVWPGRYTIDITYRYDGQEGFAHYTEVFYAANLRVLVLVVGGLVVFAAAAYRLRRAIKSFVLMFFHFVKRIGHKIRQKIKK